MESAGAAGVVVVAGDCKEVAMSLFDRSKFISASYFCASAWSDCCFKVLTWFSISDLVVIALRIAACASLSSCLAASMAFF